MLFAMNMLAFSDINKSVSILIPGAPRMRLLMALAVLATGPFLPCPFLPCPAVASEQAIADEEAADDQGLLPTEGLPVARWDEAARLIGRRAVIYGKITDVGRTENIRFLNFRSRDGASGDDDKTKDADKNAKSAASDFTVVIFRESDSKFEKPYEELFLNKNVTIVGTVTLYRGSPQIVVGDPVQIQVVDKLPQTKIVAPVKITIGEELVIASYNVKNLFDNANDPYHSDEGTRAKPRSEMRHLARVIREINADVLALQEVESRGYLQQFLETMLYDMGYEHVVHFEGNDGRGIDVCLISRVPVGEVTSHRHHVFKAHDGGDQRFGRDLLRVELLPDGGDSFEVWVVHLKSNSGGKELNEPIRLGECQEVHRLIARRLKQDPDVSLILCGDFNDEFKSRTLRTILGDPPILRTTFDDLPESDRITYNKDPYRSMIDFILCSPAMAERMLPGSFQIRQGSEDESGSDHNPISARFRKKVPRVARSGAPPVVTPGSDASGASLSDGAGYRSESAAVAATGANQSAGRSAMNPGSSASGDGGPRFLWAGGALLLLLLCLVGGLARNVRGHAPA